MAINRSKLIRRILYVALALVIISFLVSRVFLPAKDKTEYITETIEKGEITQTVEITGTVEPAKRYNLSFSANGKLNQLLISEGTSVKPDQILAILESKDLEIQLESQKGSVKIAEANLAKTLSGVKQEDLNNATRAIQAAQIDYLNLQNSRNNTLSLAEKNIELVREEVHQTENSVVEARNKLMTTTVPPATSEQIQELQNLLEIEEFKLTQAQARFSQAVITYNQQQNELDAAIQKANLAVQNAQENLTSLQNPLSQTDVNPIYAQINQAWQGVYLAENQLAQTVLKAPVSGVVSTINYETGESVGHGQPFIILDSKNSVIKALVSEADITKLSLGQNAIITFDALGLDQEFKGIVSKIAPAETVVQGVIYYEVKISFDNKDQNIKSGMTANIIIQTKSKKDILVAPLSAIQYEKYQPYVEILKKEDGENEVEKREVTLGLESDQDVEVISGINENEEVITFIENE